MMKNYSLRYIAILVATVLAAVACGSSATTVAEPVDGSAGNATASIGDATTNAGSSASLSAPGVIYFTTSDGELQSLTPATDDLGMLWDPAQVEGRDLAFEIAPSDQSSGVHVLTAGNEQQLDTSLQEMVAGTLQPVPNSEVIDQAICLDPHANAATTVAHKIVPSFDNTQGTEFVQVTLGGDQESIVELTRNSTTCPRYNSDRSIVITSMLTTPGDVTTESVVIDGPDSSHQISLDGCSATPRTVSPDDEWALISVVCYLDRWDESGLYAIPMIDIATVVELSDMARIAGGIFGRTAWHPDGRWMVATRIEPVPQQGPDLDVRDSRANLVLISTTGESFTQTILGQGQPHSLIWMSESFHATS